MSCDSVENTTCPTGACCTGTGCVDNVTSQFCKENYGTNYNGAGTTCNDPLIADDPACNEPEPTVACCHRNTPFLTSVPT